MSPNEEPDPILGSELRQTAGRDWSEEAAEDERLTELLRRRRLTLTEIARDAEHRGARVSVEFAGHNFAGPLIGTGEDFATVHTPGQLVDVRLEVTTWTVLPGSGAAEAVHPDVHSFKAHLQELAATAGRVGLALPDGQILVGRIDVVAVDHVELVDADERGLLVPLELILATIRSDEPH